MKISGKFPGKVAEKIFPDFHTKFSNLLRKTVKNIFQESLNILGKMRDKCEERKITKIKRERIKYRERKEGKNEQKRR